MKLDPIELEETITIFTDKVEGKKKEFEDKQKKKLEDEVKKKLGKLFG